VLRARLDEADIAAMEERLEPEDAARLAACPPEQRHYLELAFALHYGVDGVEAKTRLSRAAPPVGVHAMAHGSMAAGGSYYYADVVLEAVRDCGVDPANLDRVLDFGCSSGRVVRVLQAALPEVEWHGCDPIVPAIEWAQANLPGIQFVASHAEPPLPYEAGAFDCAYAISIWSHFSERAALRWLEEMRRVIRPGGVLVLTVQGPHSLSQFRSLWWNEDLTSVGADLYSRGFHFAEGLAHGDHGLESPHWGMAFLTAEWLLANSTPSWAVLKLAIGRAEHNQDVVVLERRR